MVSNWFQNCPKMVPAPLPILVITLGRKPHPLPRHQQDDTRTVGISNLLARTFFTQWRGPRCPTRTASTRWTGWPRTTSKQPSRLS